MAYATFERVLRVITALALSPPAAAFTAAAYPRRQDGTIADARTVEGRTGRVRKKDGAAEARGVANARGRRDEGTRRARCRAR